MRVLFVGYFADRGGSALATVPLALRLRAGGHQVAFAHWSPPGWRELFRDSDLLNFSLHERTSLPGKIRELVRLAANFDAIVPASELTVTYACQIAGWLTGRPTIGEIQVHLDEWIAAGNCSRWHAWLSRGFYPRLQAVRCVSQGLAEFAIEELGIDPEKVFVAYNPFNLDRIGQLARESLPPEAEAWFESPVVLCLGRLEAQKRFDLAIAALAEIREPLNLVVLGEGSQRASLSEQIQRAGLSDRVWLAGFYENPYPFLARARLFLSCSDYEGFGRAIVDALATGCPVVARNCPTGPAEILQHGEIGWLVNSDRPDAIAEAVKTLLARPELAASFAERGRLRSRDFDEKVVGDRYLDHLQRYCQAWGVA